MSARQKRNPDDRSAAWEPNRKLTHGKGPEPTARDCIAVIGHPYRRRILRILHNANEARSPNEISKALDANLSHVGYHFRTLKKYRAVALTDTQQKRGSIEHFYASTVRDNELVGKFLEASQAEDEEAADK